SRRAARSPDVIATREAWILSTRARFSSVIASRSKDAAEASWEDACDSKSAARSTSSFAWNETFWVGTGRMGRTRWPSSPPETGHAPALVVKVTHAAAIAAKISVLMLTSSDMDARTTPLVEASTDAAAKGSAVCYGAGRDGALRQPGLLPQERDQG